MKIESKAIQFLGNQLIAKESQSDSLIFQKE